MARYDTNSGTSGRDFPTAEWLSPSRAGLGTGVWSSEPVNKSSAAARGPQSAPGKEWGCTIPGSIPAYVTGYGASAADRWFFHKLSLRQEYNAVRCRHLPGGDGR